MEQFLNIKQAIYDYFVNTEGKQYIEDIEITKKDDTYRIVL